MDCQDYITVKPERKKGEHLGPEERGAIKVLRKQGLGIRAIAREVGCAPSTVTNELRRGTPPRKSNRGKAQATPPSSEKRSIRLTEQSAGSPSKRSPANCSLLGWSIRFGSTSGLLIPAADTPDCIGCTVRRRWSAPVLFTIWYGPVCFRSHPLNCPKP